MASSTLKNKQKAKFKLGDSRDPCSARRSDVVYKTIIRDLRKYYLKEFNELTKYSRRKKYLPDLKYKECVT
jgi:hypothetical protein